MPPFEMLLNIGAFAAGTVNLLNSSDYETARITLDHSFAQWEANESAWQLEAQMDTLRKALDGYERAFDCEFGDFKEFMRLRMRLSDLEKNERRKLKHEVFRTQKARSEAFKDLDRPLRFTHRLRGTSIRPHLQCAERARIPRSA